jgi:hypothetical protein
MAAQTFDVCAEFPYSRVSQRRAVFSALGGLRQVRQVNQRELKIYTLTWNQAPLQLQRRITASWDATYGPVCAMNYTPEGESQIEVRFAEDTLSRLYDSAVTGSLTIELEEVL